jgi:hypothetical protein
MYYSAAVNRITAIPADEVRFWNIVRSRAQIRSTMHSAP